VIGVDAGFISTQMVKFHTSGDRANKCLVHNNVTGPNSLRPIRLASLTNLTVAVAVAATLKNPAAIY
jgi:hypothetical protein